MSASYVVTGGGRGVGCAIAARLVGDGAAVIVIEKDPAATTWAREHAAGQRIVAVHGDAAQESVAERAADLAQQAGTFTGPSRLTTAPVASASMRERSAPSAPSATRSCWPAKTRRLQP